MGESCKVQELSSHFEWRTSASPKRNHMRLQVSEFSAKITVICVGSVPRTRHISQVTEVDSTKCGEFSAVLSREIPSELAYLNSRNQFTLLFTGRCSGAGDVLLHVNFLGLFRSSAISSNLTDNHLACTRNRGEGLHQSTLSSVISPVEQPQAAEESEEMEGLGQRSGGDRKEVGDTEGDSERQRA